MDAGERAIVRIISIIFKTGAIFLALMMLVTVADVTMRYVFNRPIIGSYEITEYMMVVLVAFGIAYCTISKSQINVDLLTARLSLKVQHTLGIIVSFLSLAIITIMTWQMWIQVESQYRSHAVSSALEIPEYPFAAAAAFGLSLLVIALVLEIFHYFYKAGMT